MNTTRHEKPPELFWLRATGLAGIGAAGLMFFSDAIFMDSSAAGHEFGRVAFDRLETSPNWRLTLGGIGGPVAACFFVVGFAHVFLALRPPGSLAAFLCALGFAAGYIILGAWHACGALIAHIARLLPANTHPTTHESWTYMMYLGFIGVVPTTFSLVLLPLLILLRPTRYPKWFAAVNPGLIYLGAFVFVYVPAPLGGYLVMGSGSLSFLVFFLASTTVLWNGGAEKTMTS